MLQKPTIYLYASGKEITYKAKYSRVLRDISSSLSHRRYDPSKKQWFIWPASYMQLLSELAKTNYEVKAHKSIDKLVKVYRRSLKERLKLKRLKSIEFDLNGYFNDEYPLRDYQKVGANFLYRGKRVLLGDPVGVGKTVMAIAAFTMALLNDKIEFVLIVVPANLRNKWDNEIRKFTDFEPIDMQYCKNRIKTYEKIFVGSEKRDKFILINSYASLTRDIYTTKTIRQVNRTIKKKVVRKDGLLSVLNKHKGIKLGFIFDEIQKCKNYNSQRTKAAFKIAEFGRHVYGLSATPVEGYLQDLFNVFRVIEPNILGTFKHFDENYFLRNWAGEIYDYKNLNDVVKRIDPYIIRRSVEDIDVDLPDEIYQEYWLNLTNQQRKLYRSIIDEHLKSFNATGNIFLEMLNERKCCLSTELMDPDMKIAPKIDVLKDIISSIEEDSKIVVFSFFGQSVPMIDIIKRELDNDPEFNFETLMLKGGMSDSHKQSIIDKFSNDENAKVLLTTDVSREGHDIVAARHVVHFDLLWNPAAMRQRAGRLIRFNQKAKSVVIHTIITRKTIEEYMWDKVLKKGNLMKHILDKNREEFRVTRKEAIKIFRDYRG